MDLESETARVRACYSSIFSENDGIGYCVDHDVCNNGVRPGVVDREILNRVGAVGQTQKSWNWRVQCDSLHATLSIRARVGGIRIHCVSEGRESRRCSRILPPLFRCEIQILGIDSGCLAVILKVDVEIELRGQGRGTVVKCALKVVRCSAEECEPLSKVIWSV